MESQSVEALTRFAKPLGPVNYRGTWRERGSLPILC